MKFKEIKPGMVIHCPTEEDAKVLLKRLDELGHRWSNNGERLVNKTDYDVHGECTCYWLRETNEIVCGHYADYQKGGYYVHYQKDGFQITEFSDLCELTADDLMEFYEQHEKDGTLKEIFGRESDLSGLLKDFTPKEIVSKIKSWLLSNETDSEYETVDVCCIMEVLPDGTHKAVHTEDLNPDYTGGERKQAEEILKAYCKEHIGKFIAVHEVISREKETK